MRDLSFVYKNHQGQIETRVVVPQSLDFIFTPGYNYQPGWFVTGFDRDRQDFRSFNLAHFILDPSLEDVRKYSLKLED